MDLFPELLKAVSCSLSGGRVTDDQLEGTVRALLDQHFEPAQVEVLKQNALRARRLLDERAIQQNRKDRSQGPKIFLVFVCSDSRVVPSDIDALGNFIITVPLAGESLDDDFPYDQITQLLPVIDGIVVEGHQDCGACKAAAAARAGQSFDGTLRVLTANVDGTIAVNVQQQIKHLIDHIGLQDLVEHEVPVIGSINDIFAGSGEVTHSMLEVSGVDQLQTSSNARSAIEAYRKVCAATKVTDHPAAERFQHPSVLWLTGLSLPELLDRGLGSEHEIMAEHRKGVVFKVGWQNPEDGCMVGSARYILSHGDSVKQIVCTASTEAGVLQMLQAFVRNQEVCSYAASHPGTELIGLVVREDGTIDPARIVRYT